MGFQPVQAVTSPFLSELDGGLATFSDKSELQFPKGCVYEPQQIGEKLAQRVTLGERTCTVIRGATLRSVEAAIALLKG